MGSFDRLDGLDWRIIRALADNDMKVCVAAEKLHYCEGTLYYHINKIRRLTGLDPKRFWDLAKLVKCMKEDFCCE
jgi:sugar diacid utilization regulator